MAILRRCKFTLLIVLIFVGYHELWTSMPSDLYSIVYILNLWDSLKFCWIFFLLPKSWLITSDSSFCGYLHLQILFFWHLKEYFMPFLTSKYHRLTWCTCWLHGNKNCGPFQPRFAYFHPGVWPVVYCWCSGWHEKSWITSVCFLGLNRILGPLYSRAWGPMTIEIWNLSLMEKGWDSHFALELEGLRDPGSLNGWKTYMACNMFHGLPDFASSPLQRGPHEQDVNEIAFSWEPVHVCLYVTLEALWPHKIQSQFSMVWPSDEFQGPSQCRGHNPWPVV